MLFDVLIFLKDEQHDPLLNSFAHLKEALQSIAGKYSLF